MTNQRLVQGNEACAHGALYAGCNFFAGYPITPSTEVMEILAGELPALGRTFIQMEDEIASISAVIAAANMAAYNSAKAAVRHLSKSVALHCARAGYNVTCNTLMPTFIDTPLIDGLTGGRERTEMVAKLARQVPLGRIGEPDDVAYAAVYLCSDEAKFVTGAELCIDGGISAM